MNASAQLGIHPRNVGTFGRKTQKHPDRTSLTRRQQDCYFVVGREEKSLMHINDNSMRLSKMKSDYPHRYYYEEVRNMEQKLFEEYPEIVTVFDLMDMLKIGRNLAYRLVRKGDIKCRKVGRDFKITKSAVIEYLTKKED